MRLQSFCATGQNCAEWDSCPSITYVANIILWASYSHNQSMRWKFPPFWWWKIIFMENSNLIHIYYKHFPCQQHHLLVQHSPYHQHHPIVMQYSPINDVFYYFIKDHVLTTTYFETLIPTLKVNHFPPFGIIKSKYSKPR